MGIDPITVDFETAGIVGNPIVDPPNPCGVAIWIPEQKPFYLAWGHPEFEVGDPRWPAGSKNSCTYHEAHQYLKRIRDSNRPLLFHHAGFDVPVWEAHFCNARLWWARNKERIHDTLYLLFLADPYSATFSLKPSADRYLGMQPDEQTELYDWIVRHVPEATRKTAGAYICRAPADLVSSYAVGDVVRTRKLFDLLHPKIVELGMEAAYDRERILAPTLVDATKRGIRIDRYVLEHHEAVYARALSIADDRIRSLLGFQGEIGPNEAFSEALDRADAIESWVMTKTGKRSMAAGNIKITRPDVKILYEYRGALSTCLTTFIRPWLEFSGVDSRVHPNWNQVRQQGYGNDSKGTKTGRLSSDRPNFQNVPSEFTDVLGKPLVVPEDLVPLPIMRGYCLPEEGHVWIKRDFSSQEIRILAHFEDGSLKEAYCANPNLDPHQMAMDLINALIGILYARKDVKITGFSIIYGTGANGLSIQLGRTYEEAYTIKEAYLTAMPAVRSLMQDVQRRGRSNQPVRTWGSRLYYAEPPRMVDGRIRDFAYKLLNYLIQGSAADQTKQAIIDWKETTGGKCYEIQLLATVHDEIDISAPEELAQEAMTNLRIAMDKDRFDVPFKSEGYAGPNWAHLEKIE